MAFGNNYFPATYQQAYYPQYQQTPVYNAQQNQQAQHSGIIWVQGEAGAKSYMVAPNSTVQLWDSESQTIYLKSADASGMPSMRILDYTIRDMPQTAPQATQGAQYATKEELVGLRKELEELKGRLEVKKDESVV